MVETRASKRRKSVKSVLLHVQLPNEIVVEILSKLPVKSLLKFRCVSKSWLSLISSPGFVKTHLCSSANNKEYNNHRVILKDMRCALTDCSLRSLLYNRITEPSEIDYPMKSFKIRWFDTANGLICLAGTKNYDYRPIGINSEIWPSCEVNLCIWNPSIRKWKILPRVTSRPIYFPSFRYGFGHDELNDDYKVVVMFDDNPSFQKTVRIYSLKKDSWRTIWDFQGASIMDCSAKCVKGKLYWSSCLSDHEYTIVSFDLANEKWDKVEQPDFGEGKFDLKLGVLGSDLVVLCNYERTHSVLWVMNDVVESSWTKMFTISSADVPVTYDYDYNPHLRLPFTPPFCQAYKGEILLLYHSLFMVYNPTDRSNRPAEVTDLQCCLEAEIFVESLVNPLELH